MPRQSLILAAFFIASSLLSCRGPEGPVGPPGPPGGDGSLTDPRIQPKVIFTFPTAKDVNGNILSPPFSMTFKPEPFFRIVRVNPPPGVSDVAKFSLIWIYFNSAVDTSTFSRIHITPPMRGLWNYGYGYYYPDSSV